MFGLKTEGAFDSAHFLTDYYGKCENLHGHRWRVEQIQYRRDEDGGYDAADMSLSRTGDKYDRYIH